MSLIFQVTSNTWADLNVTCDINCNAIISHTSTSCSHIQVVITTQNKAAPIDQLLIIL